jgi:hypothetical protein
VMSFTFDGPAVRPLSSRCARWAWTWNRAPARTRVVSPERGSGMMAVRPACSRPPRPPPARRRWAARGRR